MRTPDLSLLRVGKEGGAGIAFLNTVRTILLSICPAFYHYATGKIWRTKPHTSASPHLHEMQ